MDKNQKAREKDKFGIRPLSEGLKPTSGCKEPKAPKGGTGQSNKGK